jgi:hypothetical protein
MILYWKDIQDKQEVVVVFGSCSKSSLSIVS